jgi:hypothetical protein
MRLAADPPPVKLPLNPSHPMACASQPTTICSIVTAEGDDRHAVTFCLSTLASKSAAAATGSPDPKT